MNVYVIGGGASGMVSAIVSKRKGNNVCIIEKNSLGKKLLLTGNGRCNYFNDNMDLDNYYNEDVSKIINKDNLKKLSDFFDSLGFAPRIKDGLYYPYSNTATAIHKALTKEIEVLNIKVINEEVVNITKDLKIETNNKVYQADKIVLATGGITYPKTGSNGFGYSMLEKLGHKINRPFPALVPLKTDENVKEWAGIRLRAKVSFKSDTIKRSEVGEVQLTDYGISGICVMNVSRYFNPAKKNSLIIDFLPDIDIKDALIKRDSLLKNRTIIELLEMYINYKLLYFIFKRLHLNVSLKLSEINKNDLELLIKNLKEFELNIVDVKSMIDGETTKGGLPLDSVTSNMESTLIKGLYITGELLDVDGICGGYNLTNAFISGMLAGGIND